MYSLKKSEERDGISLYDWTNIFDYGGPEMQFTTVVNAWTDFDSEPNFAGVVYHHLGFYSFEGWHDYTGWDCQSNVEWFGPFSSELFAVEELSSEARRNLGYEVSPIPEGYLYGY